MKDDVLEFPRNAVGALDLSKRLNSMEVGETIEFYSPDQRLNFRIMSASNDYLVYGKEFSRMNLQKKANNYYWIDCWDQESTDRAPVHVQGVHILSSTDWMKGFIPESKRSSKLTGPSVAIRLINFGDSATLHLYDQPA